MYYRETPNLHLTHSVSTCTWGTKGFLTTTFGPARRPPTNLAPATVATRVSCPFGRMVFDKEEGNYASPERGLFSPDKRGHFSLSFIPRSLRFLRGKNAVRESLFSKLRPSLHGRKTINLSFMISQPLCVLVSGNKGQTPVEVPAPQGTWFPKSTEIPGSLFNVPKFSLSFQFLRIFRRTLHPLARRPQASQTCSPPCWGLFVRSPF